MRRRPSPVAIVDAVVLAAAVLFVFWQLRPDLLLANTTAAGGDMGAHVYGPAFLRDHLLPHGRLSGWSPGWYDGFPLYHFYFPLPSIMIVGLGTLIPYDIAFKLVTVLGACSLPVCAYYFAKWNGLRFPGPALTGLATIPFLFDRFHTIYGGNLPSVLAGEFSFSLSLSFALLFLGVFGLGLRTGRHRGWAAVLLAATLLCHLLPTVFAIGGALVLLALHYDRRRVLRYALPVGAVSGLLVAFWLLPFKQQLPYANDMGWEKITAYLKNLLPFLSTREAGSGNLEPNQFYWQQVFHLVPVALLALGGGVLAIMRRNRYGMLLTALALGSAFVFRFAPAARLWNARALPFWFLVLYLLAAFAVTQVVELFQQGSVQRRLAALQPGELGPPPPATAWERTWPFGVAPVVAAIVLLFVAVPLDVLPGWFPFKPSVNDRSFIGDWAAWNYSGYERKAKWPEYRDLVATMKTVGQEHGCGRAMWEYKPELNDYGTPMALMLLPYWTNECIGSQEGLFFESAATTPFHFLVQSELSTTPSTAQRDLPYRSLAPGGQVDQSVFDAGIRHLQLLGVRYYLASTGPAIAGAEANADLTPLATSGPWRIYQVADSALVQPIDQLPAVIQGWSTRTNGHWMDVAVPWFQDPDRWDVPLAQSGPKSWPRVQVTHTKSADHTVGAGVTVAPPETEPVRPATVRNIRTSDDRVSFDVDRPGTPVLVKTSYFPDWKASGANGPWRVAPNLMVVVPTSTHVSLHYGRTAVDWLGWLLTLLGIAAVVWLWRAKPVEYAEPPAGDEGTASEAEPELDRDDMWAPRESEPPEHEPEPDRRDAPVPTHFLTPEPGS